MIFFIMVYSIVAMQETHVKNFLIESSKAGKAEYRFVKPVVCQSGRLKNTYAIAQNGKVGPGPRETSRRGTRRR